MRNLDRLMSSHHTRWCLAASWISLALLLFIAPAAWSAERGLLLAVIGFLSPMFMLIPWGEPSLTIAEVNRATEERR